MIKMEELGKAGKATRNILWQTCESGALLLENMAHRQSMTAVVLNEKFIQESVFCSVNNFSLYFVSGVLILCGFKAYMKGLQWYGG